MEKLAHYLELKTLQYPTEDTSEVKKAINTVLNIEKEELNEELKTEEIESQYGAVIKKHEYKTEKWSKVKEIMKRIFQEIGKLEEIYQHLDSEKGEFYIRLDKQELHRRKIKPLKKGDVVHIKVKIASYPFREEKIKKNLKKLLEAD
ncbi:MAG: RNA-binding domain-containing protein [archaeon]